ncbi:RdgB/HAM1 family non-canonical purine NTP pyrophosphatase [Methanospirillum sp. J.3.6.1-F.2.7.3]|uniref:RdgB/HAM1 family non-canonical purine NTP pyrophosphatase n=2 Tax=Methanospirillum TaxID=2202 RepID=A0A8E7B239_9EURY|nr:MULTISPECIES: RdgB/HAM1 family non-canonical purine NTP pyrophosphatase [Methanospirillum]MDX8549262.1 RdgB/HAM1 family non-canonical purine NTP pyrophosphatase [Methanospirillum hungatei]NLW76014.1 RdgB/HAM1 family non-canonical purine NTP pyrophosphatase [Methanomicrobiales archaeon]QVV89439.1 RdgB/HAM1 family non-canonical purine NTP pyrophosphatase [Methanospirillum sp. J.3.6.1-F.2.7.3]QXO96272.1 RdgB/HAM1 family non-canonical purine NTP pyrophosphatase [Methanospirillum hungatei]
MRITFVTSNEHKAREAAGILAGLAEIEHVSMDIPELRYDSIAEIAAGKAAYAFSVLKRPVITDDTGLFIPALNGFPGTCAAYVQKTIGNAGILTLMAGFANRSATFETGIAYYDGVRQKVCTGTIDGKIVVPRGCSGFGYDPVFEVDGVTLAEMTEEEKNRISHRAIGLHALRDWLAEELRRDQA